MRNKKIVMIMPLYTQYVRSWLVNVILVPNSQIYKRNNLVFSVCWPIQSILNSLILFDFNIWKNSILLIFKLISIFIFSIYWLKNYNHFRNNFY